MSRWRDLPSLSLLRAFDATATHGSFAEAGRVLNVTHAAVTQAVRALEAELGVTLVRRSGRTVALTEAGEALARALAEGFGAMEKGITALHRAEARRVVRVATTTFIAEMHIMPRLPDFWARYPGIDVAMTPSQTRVDLSHDGFDLAVRALSDGWVVPATEEVRPLARTPLLVVGAPALLAGGASLQDLPWVLDSGQSWDRDRLRDAGVDPDTLKLVKLGSAHLEMSAARRGLGVTLATEIICRDDLAAGRLVAVPVQGLPSLTYAAVMSKGVRRPAVQQFVDWLATIF